MLLLAVRPLPNQAYPTERLGQGQSRTKATRDVVAQWLPSKQAHQVFFWQEGRRIGGLLACQSRHGLKTWEVAQFLLSNENDLSCTNLFGQVKNQAVGAGIHRLFLRVSSDNPCLAAIQHAGFTEYITERLYVLDSPGTVTAQADAPLGWMRQRHPADDHDLFRLYNQTAPLAIRTAEGMTMTEWSESSTVRWGFGRGASEEVLEQDDTIVAWTRTAKANGSGHLSISLHPDAHEMFPRLLRRGVSRLRKQPRVYSLVPEHQSQHIVSLENMGFKRLDEYISFVWEAPARIKNPEFVAARVI